MDTAPFTERHWGLGDIGTSKKGEIMSEERIPYSGRVQWIQAVLLSISMIYLWGLGNTATANLVQNGSFESTTLVSPGGYICQLGITCISNVANWDSACALAGPCGTGGTVASLLFPGTNGVAFNSFNGLAGTVSDSPNGGNFVAIDGDPFFVAPLFQTINGLTPGATYVLRFYQAAGQQIGAPGDTTERWQVTFGGQTQLSDLMLNPNQDFQPWQPQTMTFVATAASQVLTFLSVGTPAGGPPVALLDGVSLIAAVPEPATWTILIASMIGFGALAWRRRKA